MPRKKRGCGDRSRSAKLAARTRKGDGQPALSDVELTAVIVWLRWEGQLARAQRDVWAKALQTHRSQQTVASHRYWSDALHTLSAALGRATKALADGVTLDRLPSATLDSVDVLARN